MVDDKEDQSGSPQVTQLGYGNTTERKCKPESDEQKQRENLFIGRKTYIA
jgi:hypothetical protein